MSQTPPPDQVALSDVERGETLSADVIELTAQGIARQSSHATLGETAVPSDAEMSGGKTASGHAISGQLVSGQLVSERYRVEALLGEGGMGAVYRAEHILMRRQVAIKVLHGELSSHSEIAARFQREAQAASAIQHPNICAATDFGVLPDGSSFLVMEYLEGETLERALRAYGKLGPRRTIHIIQQVLSVLAEAHERGIVHRDLKPENIMLVELAGRADVVKVMDFGIASMKDVDGEESNARLTRAGVAYGTPTYMSPEQVAGQADIDGRADLYAVGVMMFEMLTGSVPYQGANVASVMAQHLTAPAPSLRQRAPDANIPPALESVVLRLLSKSPEERFNDARHLTEVLADLDPVDASRLATGLHTVTPSGRVVAQTPLRARTTHSLESLLGLEAGSITSRQLRVAGAIGAAGVTLTLVALILTFRALFGGPGDGEKAQAETQAEALAAMAPAERQAALAEEIHVTTRTLAEERDAFVADTEGMRSLLERMAAGEHKSALEQLETRAEVLDGSAHYHYYMGVASASVPKKGGDVTRFYLRALTLDARYGGEDRVLGHLADVLASPRDKDRQEVLDAADPLMRARLGQRLLSRAMDEEQKASARKSAVDAMRELNLWESVPASQQAVIALDTETGCKARGEAITRIELAGDPRGLDTLRKWSRKPRDTCGKFFRKEDCYACIRGDLRRAITTLERVAREAE